MEKLDRIDWEKFRAELSNKINKEQFKMICELHAKYYNHRFYKPCTCNPNTIKLWIKQLNDVYDSNGNDA